MVSMSIGIQCTRQYPRQVPLLGGTCSVCGLEAAKGMEVHGGKLVCALCDASLHIDSAGEAGVLIWLPEMQQGTLNLVCLSIFMAMRLDDQKLRDLAANRYRQLSMERVTLAEGLFGGKTEVSRGGGDAAIKAASHPSWMGQFMKELGIKQVDGVRLLPRASYFGPVIAEWRKTMTLDIEECSRISDDMRLAAT